MELYGGIDLHSNNIYLTLLDQDDRVVFERRLANDLDVIRRALLPYRSAIRGLVVESTYNWYWLVDGLMADGYRVHLANTAAIKSYEGLKHGDDASDAAWLAHLLRLGLLPEGYIYPAAERGLRDLLRKRGQLVRQKTTNILSIETQLARTTGRHPGGNRIKKLDEAAVAALVEDADVALAIASNLAVMRCLEARIAVLEEAVLARARLKPAFRWLLTVPGIGRVLGLTIALETGDVGRFAKVGNFASYCRCVSSERLSNGKRKGRGNAKNGNKHLAWAFVEAANFALRYSPEARRFYQRKRAKVGPVVAIKAVAHKLARAAYYVMRDGVRFDASRCFA
jgi:transposase